MKVPGILLLCLLFAGVARGDTATTTPSIGGTSLSALLIENQKEINANLAAANLMQADQAISNPITYYESLYYRTGGGPMISWLGLPLGKITSSPAFRLIYWTIILLAGGFCAIHAIGSLSIEGASPMRADQSYYNIYMRFFLKMMAGSLIVANPGLVYAVAMSLRDSFTRVVEDVVMSSPSGAQTVQNTIGKTNLDTFSYDIIRDRAIQRAIDERIAITQNFDNDTDRQEMGKLMNAMGATVNQAVGKTMVPIAPDADISSGNSTVHVRLMAEQFVNVFRGLASVQQPSEVSANYGAGGAIPLQTAGSLLFNPDKAPQKTRLAAEALPHTADNRQQLEALSTQYEGEVLRCMKDVIDMDLGRMMAQAPQQGFFGKATTVFKNIEEAVAVKFNIIKQVMEMLIGLINSVLAYIIARGASVVLNLLIELNVFLLVVCMPLWLWPTTPRAFTGIVRSIFNAALVMPTFQILIFITDAVFAKMLQFTAVAGNTALVASVETGGLPLLGIVLGYIAAYVVTVFIILKRTPKILDALFQGTGAVSGYLGGVATGAMAGALTTLGVAAAPAAMAGFSGAGAKVGAAAGTAGKAVASRVPAAMRNAASTRVRMAASAAKSAYSSLPQPIQGAASGAGRAMRRVFSAGPAATAASVSSAPAAGAAAAGGGVPSGLMQAAAAHPSATKPIRFALKTVGREIAAGALASDPGDYLRRRNDMIEAEKRSEAEKRR